MSSKKPAGPEGPASKRATRTRKIDLSNVPLRREAAVWVEPLTLSDEHRTQLAKWLDDAAIDSLTSRLAHVRAEMRNERENPPPTVGQQRQHLEAIRTTAEALAELLTRTSTSVSAQLSAISHAWLGGVQEKRALAKRLQMLSLGCAERLREMPEQGRRRAPVFLVWQVAEVAAPAGIRLSSSPTSHFKRLCDVALEIVGRPGSSEGAIDAYLRAVETAPEK